MFRKQYVRYGGLAVTFCAAACIIVFAITAGRPPQTGASPQAATVQQSASVTLRYQLPNGEVKEVTNPVPAELVGAVLSNAAAIRPDWHIVELQPEKIVADVTCSSGGYLGVYNGYVAFYKGEPGPCSILETVTDIEVASVHPAARAKLPNGIAYADDNQRQELLDGLIFD